MNKTIVALMFCFLLTAGNKIFALTISGTDTILTNHEYGFDFINQVACTTFIYNHSYDCYNHFNFVWYPSINQFDLSSDGYGVQCGKVNLDSIKTAPPDSIFNKISLHIDSIPQDSLSSYLGNSYIIKSGVDPRDASIYFAKIRIVGFRVVDSASHTIVMRFLWACNVNNSRDISTSDLDTFKFTTATIPSGATQRSFTLTTGQRVFKVVGDKFVVPKEWVGSGAYLSVYNLAGKMLVRMPLLDNKKINLVKINGVTSGMLLAKIEK